MSELQLFEQLRKGVFAAADSSFPWWRVARITDFSFSRSLLSIERANFFPFTAQNNTEGGGWPGLGALDFVDMRIAERISLHYVSQK